jgi:TolB-like protein
MANGPCPVCGTLFADNSESCPVCAPQDALEPRIDSPSSTPFDLTMKRLRKNVLGWLITLGLCLVGPVGWYFIQYQLTNRHGGDAAHSDKSIAVLPFESLSPNEEDTYFADGVQEEILADLARISELKVSSRTSVTRYRPDDQRNLFEIANALGVANILEGAVRRGGRKIWITVQLVNAATDQTIWSEIYERDLSDIFAIQSEVTQIVASKLTATLSPEEKNRIQMQPTNNFEAYDLYLRAKEIMRSPNASRFGCSSKPLGKATSLLEQAVRLDWRFTLAYCAFAEANGQLYIAILRIDLAQLTPHEEKRNSESGSQPCRRSNGPW